ncbi:hypothetical protein N0V90_005843 [Kalmusia sp. IMI 367209]|nr:hypothetical protein N0V90_005843 [Kalmusia sp. IMI 367209]
MTKEEESRQKIQQVLSETDDEPTQIDQIAAIRGWFRPAPKSIFYPAVQEYVKGSTNLQTTVANITKPIDEALTTHKIENIDVMDLWYSIFHSAKRISYRDAGSHTKLVNLLKAIRDHPEPSSTSEHPIYSTLSGLPMADREAYNDSPRYDVGVFPAEIHAWTNFNYFLARTIDAEVTDGHIFSIWSMRQALEMEPKIGTGWYEASKPALYYDAHVPGAAVWVLGLGKKLHEREQDLTPKNENQGNPGRGGDLWTGSAAFSKERWAFWKKRFGEVAEFEGVSEETKSIAKEAVEAMNRAESS